MDFALNQKTAPKLGFAAFLDLAAELGCVGVEPRNDLGRPVFDGIEPARAGEMAHERGLRFVGLSEVYPFNDWNEDQRAAVASLIETAQAAGAETVSLIPRVDRRKATAPREQSPRPIPTPRIWRSNAWPVCARAGTPSLRARRNAEIFADGFGVDRLALEGHGRVARDDEVAGNAREAGG